MKMALLKAFKHEPVGLIAQTFRTRSRLQSNMFGNFCWSLLLSLKLGLRFFLTYWSAVVQLCCYNVRWLENVSRYVVSNVYVL